MQVVLEGVAASGGVMSSRVLRVIHRSPVRRRTALPPRRQYSRRRSQTVVVRALGKDQSEDEGDTQAKERPKRGFTQGKTWSWYFDQAPAADDQANDDLIRQLSGLDKLLAILMSEAALPGTVAVALCYLLQVRPFAFAELSKGAVTTGALCALPTVLLDIYLLGIRPRQLIQARQGKDAGGAEEVDVAHSHKEVNLEETLKPKDSLELNYAYGLNNALDDYAWWARADLPVLLSETPTAALVPAIMLSAAAQELLFRGFVLNELTFTLNSAVFEQYFDGPFLNWNTEVAERLTNAQLLDLPSPPLVVTGLAALTISTLVSLLVAGVFNTGDDDMMVIEVDDLDEAVDSARAARAIEGYIALNTEMIVTDDDDDNEEVKIQIDVTTSPQELDGYRTVASNALRSLQWLATGNILQPVVSCILTDVSYLLLIKHVVPANLPKSAAERIGLNAADTPDE